MGNGLLTHENRVFGAFQVDTGANHSYEQNAQCSTDRESPYPEPGSPEEVA